MFHNGQILESLHMNLQILGYALDVDIIQRRSF